jgi:SAM-dependent methyltransferase
MKMRQDIEAYLNTIINEGLYKNKGNLKFEMQNLFKGIDFINKKVLDIGGGVGQYSFYAACMGANKVICLEPEAEGSSSKMIKKFQRLNNLLGLNNVVINPITFQNFNPNGEMFDVIILHNSINHLDETACINLLKDKNAQIIYKNIFSKLYSLSNKKADIILSDCSRYNFFNLIKIKNPFAKAIEWHKHQSPETWIILLIEAGFSKPKIRWTSFNSTKWWGNILLGNKIMAYFLRSYFNITLKKL